MNEMDKSTAEIIERITTEREELRHKLDQRIQYILMLENALEGKERIIGTLEAEIEELKEQLKK